MPILTTLYCHLLKILTAVITISLRPAILNFYEVIRTVPILQFLHACNLHTYVYFDRVHTL